MNTHAHIPTLWEKAIFKEAGQHKPGLKSMFTLII